MDKRAFFEKIKRAPNGIRYDEIRRFVEDLGFSFKGGRGSHNVFIKQGVQEILNFQDVQGLVKPYQVRQVIKIIERYKLLED